MEKKIEKDNLRQVIMDAAWDLFYEKGYENTTINDIIKRAGTSKGGFYYYFCSYCMYMVSFLICRLRSFIVLPTTSKKQKTLISFPLNTVRILFF